MLSVVCSSIFHCKCLGLGGLLGSVLCNSNLHHIIYKQWSFYLMIISCKTDSSFEVYCYGRITYLSETWMAVWDWEGEGDLYTLSQEAVNWPFECGSNDYCSNVTNCFKALTLSWDCSYQFGSWYLEDKFSGKNVIC